MGHKHTYATKTDLEKLVVRMQKTGIICSEAMREVKRQFIVSALEMTAGNRTRAAYFLGMHVDTLTRNIRALGIEVGGRRRAAHLPPLPAAVVPHDYKSPVDLNEM